MARKQKPVKIKRYKNSIGTSTNAIYRAKQIVPVVAGLVLVVVLGFLLGKPVLNFLSSAGGADSSSQDIPQSTVIENSTQTEDSSRSTPVESEDVSSGNDTPVTPPAVTKTRIYYYAPAANLSTEAGIDAVIAQMKAKGATHLVFDVKNPDGNVHYASSNQYASQLLADVQIDLSALRAKLSASGITPVARMYTFMDKLISNVERSTAVMYQGTDTRWLDSSATLGGKAWANPASTVMQDYILALTDELLSAGIKEFIFAGFHTPTGYSLDKRDFGATMDQVLANMKNLIGTLEAKISAKGGHSAWQIEYSAVDADGDYAQYIVHPYQLGADNIVITVKGADYDIGQLAVQLPAAVQNSDISAITLWVTDGVDADMAAFTGDYFVS